MGKRIMAPVLPHIAALYPRVSDPAQDRDDKTSLKTQEAGERAWALANGYAVEDEYIYRERHSAEEYYERPELSRLRADAKARRFAVVVVHSVERLARDPIHQGIIIEELDRAGVKVHFVTEPIDNDTPDGQLVRFVRACAGKIENERKKERVMRAVRERARSGKLIPSNRPTYGYLWGPERYPERHPKAGMLSKVRLIVNPQTAPMVRRLFTEAASGKTLRAIAEGLTREGVPTPTGGATWNPTSVRHLLMQPTYWGQAEALRTKAMPVEKHLRAQYAHKSRRIQRDRDERIILPDSAAPALVSADLADQVHRRLRLNQLTAVRNARYPEKGLLRGGIARCGYCGGGLYMNHINAYQRKGLNSVQPERWVYKCRNATRVRGLCSPHTIDTYKLDPVVWAKVCEVLQTPGLLEQEVEYMCTSEQPGSDVLASIDKIIAGLSAQIARKRRLFELTDDEKTQNELADEINGLAALRRQHEAERINAEVHYADWQQQQAGLEYALAWRERVSANLEGATTYERRRAILEAARVRVRLWRADHTPRVRLTMGLPMSGELSFDLDTYCDCDDTTTRADGNSARALRG